MKHIKLLIIPVLLTITFVYCSNDIDEPKDNEVETCNTVDMSFENDVFRVLQQRCITCHSSNNASGGVDLSNHSKVKAIAESGRLMGSIKHQPGYAPMPKSGSKLDECTTLKFDAWINQGFKDN